MSFILLGMFTPTVGPSSHDEQVALLVMTKGDERVVAIAASKYAAKEIIDGCEIDEGRPLALANLAASALPETNEAKTVMLRSALAIALGQAFALNELIPAYRERLAAYGTLTVLGSQAADTGELVAICPVLDPVRGACVHIVYDITQFKTLAATHEARMSNEDREAYLGHLRAHALPVSSDRPMLTIAGQAGKFLYSGFFIMHDLGKRAAGLA